MIVEGFSLMDMNSLMEFGALVTALFPLVSIGGNKSSSQQASQSVSSSAGTQESQSRSRLFGPSQTILGSQRRAIESTLPGLQERAGIGMTPSELSRRRTTALEGLGAQTRAGASNLARILGTSGLRGNITIDDLLDLEASNIAARGGIETGLADLDLRQRQQNIQNLAGLATSFAPIATGVDSTSRGTQTSSSFGFNVGKASGRGSEFALRPVAGGSTSTGIV
jgi:hypothetical protein